MSSDLELPPPISQEPSSLEPSTGHTNGSAAQNGNLRGDALNSKSKQRLSYHQSNFPRSVHPYQKTILHFYFLTTHHNNSRQTSHGYLEQPLNDARHKRHHCQWFGPVGETVQDESVKTTSELKDLANARTTPDKPAATGQPLTHYHSMFYRLLSWKSPRATGITFAVTIAFIFAARYLNVIRYAFKGLYMVLGITAAAEIAGQVVLGDGLATKLRPRKYFVIPKESLERFLDDAEQLINFFVIEFQRVVFVENIWATLLAFVSSFVSYWLIKWLPLWGLTLIFDTSLFLGPLIYIKNKEFIDEHLKNARDIASAQASQVRDIAAQHTGRATESLKGYTSEYTKRAQEIIGQTKTKTSGVKASDFPTAPKEEPVAKATEPEAVPAL